MSIKYYRVFYKWSCYPETHLIRPCDKEVVVKDYLEYEDGQTYFDHENL